MVKPKLTYRQFMRNVDRHELQVLHDDGVYRHVRGKEPGTGNRHFNIVTFPGYLCYTGDMGAYTFCRAHDMFIFFRQRRGRIWNINPSYWAEKLEATNCRGEYVKHGAAEWSDELFKNAILDHFKDHFEGMEPGEDASDEEKAKFAEMKADAMEDIESEIFCCDDMEHAGYSAADGFHHKESGLQFCDLFECRFTEWSRSFLWCCYAITWAIEKYDQRPAVPAAITWARDSEGRPLELVLNHG